MAMRLSLATVFGQLAAERLVASGSEERARAGLQQMVDATAAWYVRVAAGIGAWIATACLIGFLIVSSIVDERMSAIVVGALVVAGALLLRRRAQADFAVQLALAMSLAGQILAVVGVSSLTKSVAAGGALGLVLSVALIALYPDRTHRFLSGVIGSVAAMATVADLKLGWTIATLGPARPIVVRGSDVVVLALVAFTAWVWRVGVRDRADGVDEALEPVGYGTVVAILGLLLFSSVVAAADDLVRGYRAAGEAAWLLGPLTSVGITTALVALELAIFRERGVRMEREVVVDVVAGTVLLGIFTLFSPGVIAAVAVLALGFDRRRPMLVALAVVFLTKFASFYYFSLHLTLLEKAGVLVASGLLLLGARAYMMLRFPPPPAETAA
jgi:hypothetical protein